MYVTCAFLTFPEVADKLDMQLTTYIFEPYQCCCCIWMLLVESSFTVVTYVKQSSLRLRLFPFTKDFILKKWFVYGNSNTITIAFTWHRVTQVARRNERKTEEEEMCWAYLWTKGRMRMGKVGHTTRCHSKHQYCKCHKHIVKNANDISNAKQSHHMDTVASQNERWRLGSKKYSHTKTTIEL